MNKFANYAPISRRDFMRLSAAAAVATAIAASPLPSFASSPYNPASQSASQDMDILQYALTLEHLEAAGYKAVNASGLLSGNVQKYFQTFGAHETTHEGALTETIQKLGGKPVAAQSSYKFPAFNSQSDVLTFFQSVEELGAAAYLGQAPRLQNADLLAAALSIHNVEAQHAAILSDLIGVSPSPAFATPKTMEQVLAVVTPILNMTAPTTMPTTGADQQGDNNMTIGALLLAALGALGAGAFFRTRRSTDAS